VGIRILIHLRTFLGQTRLGKVRFFAANEYRWKWGYLATLRCIRIWCGAPCNGGAAP